ncbi:hypothetical protein FIV41_14680 [Pseudomonas marginalis]|uniref:Uncharacterized protein n=1 Tax=Pseudomonas marginalis TaxID=298 RepID=A0A9X9BSZ6_PSEMA|nr:hypothetical protein [Pseudomonas marginalis]TWR59339.1 hypothetical protein FIV41_14680 [Pseudomonas marginalis]SEC73148.1 hypothetical protein SAMN04490193_3502 [Pseudomonas marginalis]
MLDKIKTLLRRNKETTNPAIKKPYDYKIGARDNDDVKIRKIYAKHPGWVVYRTDSAIRIDIDDKDPDILLYAENHYKLAADLARIYSWLPEKLSGTESINRLVGRAITTNIVGNTEVAKNILMQAEGRLFKLKTIQGRLQYTLSAFLLVAILLLLSGIYGFQSAPLLLNIALCGALGGVLSIALGFSKLEIDLDASKFVNCLIGCSRILIAITAAIFSFFAIKSNIAFSFVEKSPENTGYFMVAMISGFIEMLVPSIMSNLAKEAPNQPINSSLTTKEETLPEENIKP